MFSLASRSTSVLFTAAFAMAIAMVAVVITWPLTAQLGRSLPGDYGDPLFVTWVMGWVNGRLMQGAWASLFDANIFFPEPNALAFSEHFIAQALMTLPLHIATGNLILGYNVAFLLTFVLTGTGTFLLARALTGSAVAACLAGGIAAFNEYRLLYEVAHLHTLSIHWFPFALYFLHRYLWTDRRVHLAAAVTSLIALNLSSIYYMAYCAPFVAIFTAAELARSGRWRQLRVWLELWAAAAAVALVTLPFLLPYLDVQRRLGISRSLDEVVRFSATLDHYRIAFPGMRAALALGAVAVVGMLFDRASRSTTLMALLMLGLAFWLSLGPVVQSGGVVIDWPGLYGILHEYVPGYSGLRVPARFAMLFFVFLALLAASGVRVIERRSRIAAAVVAAVALSVHLVGASAAPFALNQPLPSPGLVTPPPAYLTPAPESPPIYRAVGSLSDSAVIAEFPFGDSWYDLRYMYFSALHQRRLMNGYSGVFPPSFLARQRVLMQPLRDPDASARALEGATHAVVHRQAWADATGVRIGEWLEAGGWRIIADADGAVLYELPPRERIVLNRSRLREPSPP